ncbi:MAG: DUF4190 domain-containing protein [Actinomycetota bacterium]
MSEPAPPPAGRQPAHAPVVMRRSSYAVASLVFGILGFVLLPILGSILAVVFARRTKEEIAASGGTLGGEGYAHAGRILGIIGLVLAAIAIVVIILAFVALN